MYTCSASSFPSVMSLAGRWQTRLTLAITCIALIMLILTTNTGTALNLERLKQGYMAPSRTVKPPSPKAAFVAFVKNHESQTYPLAKTVRQYEDRYNSSYSHPWIFISHTPFSEEFLKVMDYTVRVPASYVVVDESQGFGLSPNLDLATAKKAVEASDSDMDTHKLSRFIAGPLFNLPQLKDLEYILYVDPGTEVTCNIHQDLFQTMHEQDKKIGFTYVTLAPESQLTDIWSTVKHFMAENPDAAASESLVDLVTSKEGTHYNGCHFWSRPMAMDLSFFRGPIYQKYFQDLDQKGGFFTKNWSDGVVISLAASILLPRSAVHYFEDVGYSQGENNHCPASRSSRFSNQCVCVPHDHLGWSHQQSCLANYYKIQKMGRPEMWGIP